MNKIFNKEILNVSCIDSLYPKKLKYIKNKPKKLYYIGNLNILDKPTIAIIGSRIFSEYGRNLAITLAYQLSINGFTVVTGGARGIDSFASYGAIKAGVASVIVLGNGIKHVFPSENLKLEQTIINLNGLILSEYEPDISPCKENFPKRNRILSGISDGILVIEANEKSGTSITVDYGLEQGKNIYAIPANIDSNFSYGTNELIKQGAKPVTSIDDILEDYHI